MKKILFCIMVICSLCACQTKSSYPDIKVWQADTKAIRTWIDNYTEAIKTADIERILSYESDDICMYPPNQPSFSGKENLRKWFIAYYNYFSPIETFSFVDFKVFGDFAYIIGRYNVQGIIKQTGEEYRDNGKFTNFFKRQSDGNWICTQSMWNSDNKTFDIHSQILDDFSGKWKLDISKSIPLPGVISSDLLITQRGNNLIIDRTNEVKNKESEKSSSNYLIGSETQNKLRSGVFTTTSSFSSGKQTFTIIETLISEKSGTKKEYKRITIYTLTAKGEILNIISDDILPEGSSRPKNERHTEMIYTKI